MSVKVTLKRQNTGLYLTGHDDGSITLGNVPFAWTADAMPADGVKLKLGYKDQYLWGDLDLLQATLTCPVRLNATATELYCKGGVYAVVNESNPDNKNIISFTPVFSDDIVGWYEPFLVASPSNVVHFLSSSKRDEGWLVQPA